MRSHLCQKCLDYYNAQEERLDEIETYTQLTTSGGPVFQNYGDVVDYKEREHDFVEEHGRLPTRKEEILILQEMEKERNGDPARAPFSKYQSKP
jgi:hypothetical protein